MRQPSNTECDDQPRKISILCVEDCPDVLEILQEALTNAGYQVLGAADGTQGLFLLTSQSSEIDAVVLDFNLPDMNGIEVATAIKANHPDLPVVLFSGTASQGQVTLSEFFDACIEKPKLLDLLATVKKLTARKPISFRRTRVQKSRTDSL
jgi:CheY-like chemotaxis protein